MTQLSNLLNIAFKFLDSLNYCASAKVLKFQYREPGKSIEFREDPSVSLPMLLRSFVVHLAAQGHNLEELVKDLPQEPTTSLVIPANPQEWTAEHLDFLLDKARLKHKQIVTDIKGMLEERKKFEKVCLVCGKRPEKFTCPPGEDRSLTTWWYERGCKGGGWYHPDCYMREPVH